jgi:iron complex outermembrane receptor protein
MKKKYLGAGAPRLSILSAAISLILCSQSFAQQTIILPTVVVSGDKMSEFGISMTGDNLEARRFANSDTVTLLNGLPGISSYTGGGVSSLPVINGLGDDRLKVTVDGMSITSACPNHMNPALSYIDPSALSQINVYAGIVPVSQGGDSIGGAIAVKSIPPLFAQPGEGLKTYGNVTAYHRSNGSVDSISVRANVATENYNLGYIGNTVDAGNYKDGNGAEVVASRYKVRNNAITIGALTGSDLWTMNIGWQDIPFQGYPNQSMDMTYNKSLSINAAYNGIFNWGTLEARAFRQHVRHKMDVLQDKAAAAGFPLADSYMPMDTDAVDLGYSVIATMPLNANQTIRFGHEFHRYSLDDWWPPLAGSMGMGPNTFWNINGGRRDRLALFSELDGRINESLTSQFGIRFERVEMNTGNVQGYYGADSPYGDAYQTDAANFNARDHKRTDLNWDLTASLRYVRNSNETYDIGFSQKTRSPNLHERYTWANEAMMAGLMNNWFGDLNSYVGNLDLRPEVAYSFKTNADWHDAERKNWQVSLAPFITYVKNYMNAVPNTSTNMYNMSGIAGRQSLMFTNQDARLYGLDISSKVFLGKAFGEWTAHGVLSYTRGKTTSGDNLYNIMPLNARLSIDHSYGPWSNSFETVLVHAKDHLSAVRAEQATSGYSIANFHTSYKLNQSVKLDASVDNLFNRQYALPLGGLEYVTGSMMTAPQPLRAMGRSINVGVSVNF